MSSQSSQGQQTLVTVAFTAIGVCALILLYLFVFVKNNADDSAQTATASNQAPTVTNINISTTSGSGTSASVTPVENDVKRVYVRGTINDPNGYGDLNTATNQYVSFYRVSAAVDNSTAGGGTTATNGSGATCSANNAYCYQADESTVFTFSNCSGNNCDYEAYFDVQYYADATDAAAASFASSEWRAYVQAKDLASATGEKYTYQATSDRASTELNTLSSLDVTSAIGYGALALSGESSTGELATVTNLGNGPLDVLVKVTSGTGQSNGAMNCSTSGNIAASAVHYAITDNNFDYSTAGTAVSITNANILDNFAQRTQAAASTASTYWKIRMPASGAAGTCSNTVNFTATPNS